MNHCLLNGLLGLLFISAAFSQDIPVKVETALLNDSTDLPISKEINEILHEMINSGIPGIVLTVNSEKGWWTLTAGLADKENNIPMTPVHLQYLQSISKTYMAVVILKLYEEGRLHLDDKITQYLTENYSQSISNPEKISIRMLLNHTSGIPEYNSVPEYINDLLQNPIRQFTSEEYIKYIKDLPPDFEPGSQYAYRNTNFLILALIADFITGDHAQYMEQVIFQPLELKNTFYRNDSDYILYPALVQSYWDQEGNGNLINVSEMQRINVASLIGDDGIVVTPRDAIRFLRGLMEGYLLSFESLNEMMKWTKNGDGIDTYGLGLDLAEFAGFKAYGHSGGGIGAGSQLYYFPEKNLYVFLAINLGTVTSSPIHTEAENLLIRLYELLLN